MATQRVVLVIVGLAVLWFGYRRLFPNDEVQIRGVLERISDAVGAGAAEESEVSRLARAASVRNAMDPQITVDAGPPFNRMSGRDAILGTVVRLNSTISELDLEFNDVQVTVNADRTTARAYLTAAARFRDGTGGRGLEARELDVTFRKLEGDWVVSGVSFVRTLETLEP